MLLLMTRMKMLFNLLQQAQAPFEDSLLQVQSQVMLLLLLMMMMMMVMIINMMMILTILLIDYDF